MKAENVCFVLCVCAFVCVSESEGALCLLWWMNDSRHGSSSPLRRPGDRERCYSTETAQSPHKQAGVRPTHTHTCTHTHTHLHATSRSPSSLPGSLLPPTLHNLSPPPVSTCLPVSWTRLPFHVKYKWAVSLWAAASLSSLNASDLSLSNAYSPP